MLSWADRAERRRRIAEACRTRCIEDVAKEEGVGIEMAHRACREQHVLPKRRPRPRRPATSETVECLFAVLRSLQERDSSLLEIAEQYGGTSQRISEIEHMAIEAGVLTPRSYVEGTKRVYRREKP